MIPQIKTNKIRVGNFTSSTIASIMTNGRAKDTLGVPCLTYIEECNMERRLGRTLESESNAKPLTWGKLVERKVFDILGIEYKLVSEETLQHPEFDFWVGSPDAQKFDEGGTIVDIKSPITLKSFCQLVDSKTINEVRDIHKDGEKYYWQLVSNAIITNSQFAELIVYVPYKKELDSIRELAQAMTDNYKYYWIANAYDEDLPSLTEGGYYKNLNIIRFEVPSEDKRMLIDRVKLCGERLIK